MSHRNVVRQLLLVAGLLLLAAVPVLAAAGFDLTWWTVDGGGGVATGSSYTLVGTIGQPDAGVLSGGSYSLGGGFWGGGMPPKGHTVFLPLILKKH